MAALNEIHQKAGAAIDDNRSAIAEAVTDRHFKLKPELEARYGAAGRAKCLQDALFHLSYLSNALRVSRRLLFAYYVVWVRAMLAARGIPEKDLAEHLVVLRESLAETLPGDLSQIACEYVDFGLEHLGEIEDGFLQQQPQPVISDKEPLSDLAAAYLDALLRGRRDKASRLILEAVDSRAASVREIYLHVFLKTQREIGRLWQLNRISVAQEHYCTAATQLIMSQLYPYIFSTERNGRALVATCVSGELHEIGVRMVSDFFELEGWDTFYLGANTPAPAILQALKERNAELIIISATMTFHIRGVGELIEKIRADEQTRNTLVMVGGYPFNAAPDLWREIGADGFSHDAPGAVETAGRLMSERKDTAQ
ncbi:MAG: cobalamin-dependent protein [Acidobacteriota bacterium]|nr:cobalamin-dependent protein [Acidobacteriota bacterium]